MRQKCDKSEEGVKVDVLNVSHVCVDERFG